MRCVGREKCSVSPINPTTTAAAAVTTTTTTSTTFTASTTTTCAATSLPRAEKGRLAGTLLLLLLLLLLRGRSGPNLEPGTVGVYVNNGSQNGLTIRRKVGPCPGTGEGGR